jgi:hypothetical protein
VGDVRTCLWGAIIRFSSLTCRSVIPGIAGRYGLALGWTTGRYPLRSTSAVDGGVSTVAPPREGRSSGEP